VKSVKSVHPFVSQSIQKCNIKIWDGRQFSKLTQFRRFYK
jgi:hypothetical protein